LRLHQGTLRDRLANKKNNRVDFREALEMGYRILRGLENLHSKKIAHLNLHLETIKFKDADYSFECFISDLGFSCSFEDLKKGSKPTGVFGFIAPELIRGEPAGPQADIFSLGVILYSRQTSNNPASWADCLSKQKRRWIS
jgi:serine/threonine protein kinase